jgi:hypothetical protein
MFNTIGQTNRTLEIFPDDRPDYSGVQAIQFLEPVNAVVRGDELPKKIWLDSRTEKIMGSFLRVPRPNIKVTAFTERGFVWDEENTLSCLVRGRLIPPNPIKLSTPDTQDGQTESTE